MAHYLFFILLLYPQWLAMEIVHESGHALTAVLTGGSVAHISIPLLGFSQTDLSRNPHPGIVAWGGPIFGCAFPLVIWLFSLRSRRPVWKYFQFFAGFCLIVNGAYIGIGWITGVGDAGDMFRYGTPKWAMALFGVVAFSSGMYLWHRLGMASETYGTG